LASTDEARLILKTMLSPAAKLQLAGSAVLVAVPFCQVVCEPVETAVDEPHAVSPLVVFLYACKETVALELSVRPISDVWPETKFLKVDGSL